MTIQFVGSNFISGLSTDIKPLNVLPGFIFFETDTTTMYVFTGTSWTQFSAGGGSGESNTSSNLGGGGIGIVLPKVGVDLPFKSINSGSDKISVANDAGNKEIDIDVVESNLTLSNFGGTLNINQGGTGQTTSSLAFNSLSPLTSLGDLLYYSGATNARLAGNTTITRKFLRQTGSGIVSSAPVWDTIIATDLPLSTTSTVGAVELATDGENAANVVVQGNDSRLSDSRTPTVHKNTHKSGGSDAFTKSDILIASTRYLETISDPLSDTGRIWVNSGLLKYWDNNSIKQTVEVKNNKDSVGGYCGLDGSGLVPLYNLGFIGNSNIAVHTTTKISTTNKSLLNSQIAYKDETGWLTDSMVSTHTTTKISTTSKSLLNSNIIYGDQDNTLGTHYIDISQISTPSDPSSGTRRIFMDNTDGKLKVRTSTGGSIDLEGGGAGSGEANTASNIGVGGVGVFDNKTDIDLQFKNINAGSSKISITNDTVNHEIDIDVVESNLALANISGTLAINKGGTGQTTAAAAFDALGPMSALGDIIYGGTSGTRIRLAGNTTATKKFLRQTGNGSISAAPVWDTIIAGDLPSATTSASGIVELATDGENAANVVVQGNDSRLSDSRTPTVHKDSHTSGGSDAFIKTDILIASTRFIETISDPTVSTGRLWVNGSQLKFWDNAGTPVKQTVEMLVNKGTVSGYCDLDGNTLVPLSRLSGIVDSNIGSHTSTKISITDKSLLNSAILYNDVDNDLGTHYIQIGVISPPSSPSSGKHRLYIDSGDSHLKRKNSAGTVKDYDGSVGEINTMSNEGVGGVGTFKQKTGVNFEMRNLNSGSNKVSVVNDTGNNEIDIDVVESNLTLDNIGGVLALTKGGTGTTGATAAFNALSPSTALGDLIYHNGTDDTKLSGNITTTKKFLRQTGDGSVSAAPAWDTIVAGDLPATIVYTGQTNTFGAFDQIFPSARLLVKNPAATFNYIITAAAITDDRTLNLPLISGTDTLATLGLAQTFTVVQTFNSSILKIRNPADTFSYTVVGGAIAADRSLTLPLLTGNDIVVTETFAQTLTNKTIAAGSNTVTGIVDANISTHTTTKISTLSKSLLNTAIVYNDQNNSLGSFYEELTAISAPSNPASGTRRLYVDSGTGKLSVRTSGGTSLSLEEQTAGETNTASNVGAAGVGVFKQKTTFDLEFKNINAGSAYITITDDTGNNEVDIDVGTNVAKLNATQTFTSAHTFNSSILKLRNPADTFSYTIVSAAIAADRSLTLPLITGTDTLAVLGLAQTFTAAQTFNTSVLKLRNPADTFSYTIVPAAIAADRSLTLPLITGTDTLATLGLAQTFTVAQTFNNSILKIRNPADTFSYTVTAAAIAADRTLTLPLITATDTLATLGLTNVFSVGQQFDAHLDLKQISAPSNPSSGYGRFYVKQIDTNNDGVFVLVKKAGGFVEVQVA